MSFQRDFRVNGPFSQIAGKLSELEKKIRDLYSRTPLQFVSPITCNMLTRDPTSVGGGTWTRSISSVQAYCGIFYNSSNANGDNFSINFYIPTGVYTLRFTAAKFTNRAIVNVAFDGSSLGNTDLYAAALDALFVAEYTGIVVSAPGMHTITFTANGKNASSSGFTVNTSEVELIKTG